MEVDSKEYDEFVLRQSACPGASVGMPGSPHDTPQELDDGQAKRLDRTFFAKPGFHKHGNSVVQAGDVILIRWDILT